MGLWKSGHWSSPMRRSNQLPGARRSTALRRIIRGASSQPRSRGAWQAGSVGAGLPRKSETVRPGDILILVQRRNPFFDALIRELRQHGVKVAGADRLQLGHAYRGPRCAGAGPVHAAAGRRLHARLRAQESIGCRAMTARRSMMPIFSPWHMGAAINRSGNDCVKAAIRDLPRAKAYLERWLAEGAGLTPFAFFSRLLVELRASFAAAARARGQ